MSRSTSRAPAAGATRYPRTEAALAWAIVVGVLLLPFVALLIGSWSPFELRYFRRSPEGGPLALPNIYFAWVAWKNFGFRIAVEVLLGVWLVLIAIAPRYRPRFSWILVALTALAGVMALADVLGVAPERSLWGNFERMQGLVGQLHLWAFFLVAGSTLRPRHWRWFFVVSIAVCVLIAFDALLEWVLPAPWQGPESPDRILGKFGSPVHLGDYLQLHLFLIALTALRVRDLTARLFLALAGALVGAVLIGTGTRAAWVGFLGGATIAAAAAGLAGLDARRRRITYATIGACAAIFVLLVLLAALAPAALEKVPVLSRLTTAGERLQLMLATCAAAWQGFLDHPLLGWGHENFSYVFLEHYQPEFASRSGFVWNDRPHNIFFQWLVEGGLAGFVTWLGVLAAYGYHLWHRANRALSLADKTLLTGLVAAYIVFASAQPDELLATMLVTAAFAFVHAAWIEQQPREGGKAAPLWAVALLAPAVAAGTWLMLEQVNLRAVRAGMMLPKTEHRPRLIYEVLEDPSFLRGEAREMFVSKVVPRLASMDPVLRAELARFAIEEMRKEIAAEPSVRNLFVTAQVLLYLGHPEEALGYLEQAQEKAPKFPRIPFEMSRALHKMGRIDEAQEVFEKARHLHPTGVYEPSVSYPARRPPTKENAQRRFRERMEQGKRDEAGKRN